MLHMRSYSLIFTSFAADSSVSPDKMLFGGRPVSGIVFDDSSFVVVD